ncbi:MAG: hypothetical protein QOK05_1363 [Chloroflexota bacterium]|jgi:hypothetical protein|nr:hypothetical protein [Chloroflexota bacterium]
MKDRTAVTVHVAPGVAEELVSTSDARFDWGRPTPGAQALAHALVSQAGGASAETEERFFHEVVLQLPFLEPWVLWRRDLEEWLARAPQALTAS